MFGWSKKEKNEKKMNQARVELARLTPKKRGEKLSRLRKRYPSRLDHDDYDFGDELFDMEMVWLYMLLIDDIAVEEADFYDNPVEDVVETIPMEEVSVAAEVEVPVTEAMGDSIPVADIEDVQEQLSQVAVDPNTAFCSSHPISTPAPEASPDPTLSSCDSDSSSDRYSGGGGDSYSSGGGGSCDSGGGGDCGGGCD